MVINLFTEINIKCTIQSINKCLEEEWDDKFNQTGKKVFLTGRGLFPF